MVVIDAVGLALLAARRYGLGLVVGVGSAACQSVADLVVIVVQRCRAKLVVLRRDQTGSLRRALLRWVATN